MSTQNSQANPVPVVKHYVVWYGPRWDDIYDCPIENRDEHAYELDKDADYFRFYDRLELDWLLDGETIHLRSKPFNFSPYYVPGGRLLNEMERESAFRGEFRYCAAQSEKYQLFGTRFYRVVALFESEIVII